MILVDSHLHLQASQFAKTRAQELVRARSLGVGFFVCNGTSELDWDLVLEIKEVEQGVIPFLGLHPWEVGLARSSWFERLTEIVASQVVGIGEIGLDSGPKALRQASIAEQQNVFCQQLDLARYWQRPVTIHCVKAWSVLVDSLVQEGPIERGFLLHGYGGSAEMIGKFLDLNGYFSVGLRLLQSNPGRLAKVLRAIPDDRLLIETDAPFAHLEVQGSQSGGEKRDACPADLVLVLRALQPLLSRDLERLAEQIYTNSRNFFSEWL